MRFRIVVSIVALVSPFLLPDSSYASIFEEYYQLYWNPIDSGALGTLLHFEDLGYGYTQGIGCFRTFWEEPDVSFYLFANDGTGSFNLRNILDFNSMPRSITGDFNGDGLTDLFAVLDQPDTGCITFFCGSSGLGIGVPFNPPYQDFGIDVGDFNNDSRDDICGTIEGKIFLWYSDGYGNFSTVVTSDSLGMTYDTRCSDLDNDSDLDILVRAENKIFIMCNNGSGTFEEACSFPLPPFFYLTSISIIDLDKNGFDDIVIVSSNSSYETLLYTFMNNGDMSFTESLVIIPGMLPLYAICTDLDLDEIPDLAIFLGSCLSIHKGLGDGTFESSPSLFEGEYLIAAQFADYDQDGSSDMSAVYNVSGSNYYLRVYPNNAGSPVSEHTSERIGVSQLSAESNPFCSTVTFSMSNTLSSVQIEIFDLGGRMITSIPTDEYGAAVWDGRNSVNELVPSGCYVVRVKEIECNSIKLLKIP